MRLLAIYMLAVSTVALWAATTDEPEEPPLDRRIYYFQHKLLPKWTHESEGAFLKDLLSGSDKAIRGAAAEVVDADFAAALAIRVIDQRERVLIQFPEPLGAPLCYFVVIERSKGSFRYLTLEQAEDLFGHGVKTAVGSWTADGGHLNHGPRTYTDAESFLAEVEAGVGKK